MQLFYCENARFLYGAAASSGNMEALEWLKRHNLPVEDRITIHQIRNVIRKGNLDILKWLHAHTKIEFDNDFSDEAARSGQLEVLKWLKAEKCGVYIGAAAQAMTQDDVAILDWLRETGWPINKGEPLEISYASQYGKLENLKWLKRNNLTKEENWQKYTNVIPAVARGDFEVVEWLIDEGECKLSPEILKYAAQGGHFEMVKWLRKEKGCPWDAQSTSTFDSWSLAYPEILKWLILNGCPTSEGCYGCPAASGDLAMLTWLHDVAKVPYDVTLCREAARKGYLDVLIWAKEKGAPWDKQSTQEAARGHQLETLKWLVDQGCPVEWWNVSLYGSLEMKKWAETRQKEK